jgi:hypothetical protein
MAMRVSVLVALAGFVSLLLRGRQLRRPRVVGFVVLGAALLAFFAEFVRPFVPPAPLRLVAPSFGTSIRRQPPAVPSPLDTIEASYTGRIYVVTPIWAPLGLRDRVRHQWSAAGRPIFTSPYYEVTGGRSQGYRLWTSAPVSALAAGTRLQVDVETEDGQLVGRAHLPVR